MSVDDFTKRSYDYVICGGGTAGLVVAARLTEDPNVTVAVLEAGGSALDDILVDCPGLFMQTFGNPKYDWNYLTVPQKGTLNKSHGWVRGRVLGGSSAINWQMFSQASRQDLDNWAELGNHGWSFDELLPYYKKFETYTPCSEKLGKELDDSYLDKSLRGTSGPIQTCFPEIDPTWAQEVWPQTVSNAGYKHVKDPRTGSAIGGFNQLTTIDPVRKRRSYAARDYYEPNAHRPNLSLLTHALVSKIELDTIYGDAKATGVSFIVNGSTHTVKANKEVIVCGGSINSPQLLELSGIGSPAILQEAGVDVVVNLPSVGENLCDHTAIAASVKIQDSYPTAETLARNPEIVKQAMDAYVNHKAGPLAGAGTTTGFASLAKVQPDFPNAEQHIQFLVEEYAKKYPNDDPAGRDQLLAKQLLDPKEAVCQLFLVPSGANSDKVAEPGKVFPSDEEGNWVIIGAGSTRSLSRGTVHIKSADPAAHPLIDPAYFKHPLDLDMMARATLHVLSLFEVEPLKSIICRDASGAPILPKNQGDKLPTTVEEAKEFVRGITYTEYHPVGTCSMNPKEKGGVVDADLKVYGTSNVRVIDASIFPLHVQGNIVSLVYAVAEKGADLIKGKTSAVTNGTNGVSAH